MKKVKICFTLVSPHLYFAEKVKLPHVNEIRFANTLSALNFEGTPTIFVHLYSLIKEFIRKSSLFLTVRS